MIVDAMLAADEVFKISEQIDDMKRYVSLNDHILEKIEETTSPVIDIPINQLPVG